MTRECHVRICERLGVKLPGPTRHFPRSPTPCSARGDLIWLLTFRSGAKGPQRSSQCPGLNEKALWKLTEGSTVKYCGESIADKRRPPIIWHWVSFKSKEEPWE